jgi:pimeloyl-ACP methyl ester carboxylesterase
MRSFYHTPWYIMRQHFLEPRAHWHGTSHFCRRWLLASMVVLLSVGLAPVLCAQECANEACRICVAAAVGGAAGCAFSGQGGDCLAKVEQQYQSCLAKSNAIPPAPPPPPSIPCGFGQDQSLDRGARPRGVLPTCPEWVLLDPVPDLVNEAGTGVVQDAHSLATLGREIEAIASDGAARLVIRIKANFAGEQMTLDLQDDGVPNQNGLESPFGVLESILVSDGMQSGSKITVTAVDTGIGNMAFALYRPSQDFSRGDADDTAKSRTIKININTTEKKLSAINFANLHPPVVLVHGLWGDREDWYGFSFDPLGNPRNSPSDGQFWTVKASYTQSLGAAITSSTPVTSSLTDVRRSALGFDYNAPNVLDQIASAIKDFNSEKKAAAVQADLVVHSMGGDIARTLVQLPQFKSTTSFSRGPIHKLITIGTPHLGSPVATQILRPENRCTWDIFARSGKLALLQATVGGKPVTGAVGDLQGCPNGSSVCYDMSGLFLHDILGGPIPSLAILKLNPPGYSGIKVPTALIAGKMNSDNLSGLSSGRAAVLLRNWCPSDPLAQSLTPTLWPSIFAGLDSDGVVSVISQLNNGSSGFIAPGDIHSAGLITLGFNTGPIIGTFTELNDHRNTLQVYLLLNWPVGTNTKGPSPFVPLP